MNHLREVSPALDAHLVTIVSPNSFEAEQYRRLRQQVEVIARERVLKVIAVTSAVMNDGKTLTAINFAGALARKRGAKVLLIDADLRRPSVARRLGREATDKGLTAALHAKGRPLADFVEQIEGTTLSILAGTTIGADTYELLTSSRLAELIGEARQNYDYVIVDTPPLVAVSDTGLLRNVVDGYLVVVSAHSTPRKLLGEALSLVDPESMLGFVYNRDDRPTFGFYRNHYRQDFRLYAPSVSDNAW